MVAFIMFISIFLLYYFYRAIKKINSAFLLRLKSQVSGTLEIYMKIFLDTADLDDIKKWSAAGIIDGVTTNPTHLSKEKGNPTKLIIEICSQMDGKPVSVEITE